MSMVKIVGESALEGLLGRKGVGNELESYKYDDPEIWDEIVEETGRAALRAMMEPSEEMLGIGCGITDFVLPDAVWATPEAHKIEMKAAWQAMIKAALEETDESGEAV